MGSRQGKRRTAGIKFIAIDITVVCPGPGMPMVLMSGWIAADSLDRDRSVPTTKPAALSCARTSRLSLRTASRTPPPNRASRDVIAFSGSRIRQTAGMA